MTKRLLATYLSVTAFVLTVFAVPLGINFARQERRGLVADLQRDALVLATLVEDGLEAGTPSGLTGIAADYTASTGARVVVVDQAGIGVADSEPPAPGSRDFSTRPEIIAALAGDITSGVRESNTLGTGLLYVAVPVASGGVVHGAVRITYPTTELQRRIWRNWLTLALVSLVALAATGIVGWWLARSVTRPVRSLEHAAGSLGAGDLSARAPDDAGPPEIQHLATRFNEMAARLQELVAAQRAFVADASHQLRTPLTALRLRLENLQTTGADGGDDVDAAVRETMRLSRIVDGLLAIARVEGTRPERAPVDLAAVLADRVAAWEPLAAERGIALDAEGDPGGEILDVPGHIEQVLDNLIANAIEVAAARVTLSVEPQAGSVRVHVRDDGPGMDADERTRAFDRFWRATDAPPGGSGLGLSIVHQLVTASGGTVSLEEAPGGGLDAVVTLATAAHARGDAKD